jgi:hypothetical protein
MTDQSSPSEPRYKEYEALAEEAYADIYDSFRNPAGCWSDCKDWFVLAIGWAEQEGLTAEAARLHARFEQLKKHYRNQF